MTRIVGQKDRDEFELDPVRAFHRGRALDAMLGHALPPVRRGVYRGTHQVLNRMDDDRAVEAARRLNARD